MQRNSKRRNGSESARMRTDEDTTTTTIRGIIGGIRRGGVRGTRMIETGGAGTIVVIGIGDVGTMVMIETGGGEATAMMSIIGAKRKTEGEERGNGMIVITTADGHDDITAIETGRGTEVKTADAEAGQMGTERKCFHKPI